MPGPRHNPLLRARPCLALLVPLAAPPPRRQTPVPHLLLRTVTGVTGLRRVLRLGRFLASKEQFHAYLRAGGERSSGGEEETEEEEKVEEKKEEVSSCQSEPPAKRVKSEDLGQDGESRENAGAEEKEPTERKRARGQNKSRPCMKPNHYEQSRLCPSVTQVGCGGPALRCSGVGNLGPWWALPAPGLHLFLSPGEHIEDRAAAGQTASRESAAGGCAGKTTSVGWLWLGEGEAG